MNAIDDFSAKITEVDILIAYSKRNQKDIAKYQLFNKTAEVLLATKFECFLEDFFEEHMARILRGHTPTTISSTIKICYADYAAEQMLTTKKAIEKDKIIKSLGTFLNSTLSDLSALKSIQPPIKFNYGKHGQKEIENLFIRYGMERFIKSSESKSFLMQYNSCVSIRNNIIHQDASPSLTHEVVRTHKELVINFVNSLRQDVEEHKLEYYNEI